MIMLGPGSWMDLPAALRFSCQMRFIARPPSWIASEEPVVAVPMAWWCEGAFQSSANMEMPVEMCQLERMVVGPQVTHNEYGCPALQGIHPDRSSSSRYSPA